MTPPTTLIISLWVFHVSVGDRESRQFFPHTLQSHPQQLSSAGVGGLPQAASSELFINKGPNCSGTWVPQVWLRT